jgi:hypothetical protein
LTGLRLALPFAAALACAAAAAAVAPRAFEAQALLSAQDDPAELAGRMLDRSFDAAVAAREIDSALRAGDDDLARSFLDLARERRVPVDPALADRIAAASSTAAGAGRTAQSFARGMISGEPSDMAGLAGTAVGDLFVFGDIRDAVREGTRLVRGEPADEAILALAGVGIVITAGTYATVGLGAPARAGLSLLKAARRTGRMSAGLAAWLGRSLHGLVDWAVLRQAVGGALTQPVLAVRGVREAVKVEKAQDKARELTRLAGDVGKVQGRAGTAAVLDGLKVVEQPKEMTRVAQLADKYGNKTRAVLKLGGRGALLLGASAVNLFGWLLSATLTALGFCASCKRTVERATERYLHRRKLPAARSRAAALAA